MKVLITNTYHDTNEVVEVDSLKTAKQNVELGLEVTADNLAPNEVEPDWKEYYTTYDGALQATYEDILAQLKSEFEYKVIENNLNKS